MYDFAFKCAMMQWEPIKQEQLYESLIDVGEFHRTICFFST